jgi:epithelial splicing regulatory protein 1/2
VVKLRGLPYSADHKDIAVFLSGLNIIPGGVVFNINQVGRRTGEAIVVLEDEQQTSLALERDHHYLNQRYIEVKPSSCRSLL